MKKPEWYGTKTIYKHRRVEAGMRKTLFEERVVLFQAADFDGAIALAEAEAAEYCRANADTVYLDFMDVFHLFAKAVGHGTEVYSLMRESELADKDYLDHFYDDGKERTKEVEG